jgi:ubiquinone/menaquinone biosynthesis C-methylase UbiE
MLSHEVKQDIKNLYARFAEAGMAQKHHTFIDTANYAFCRKNYDRSDLSTVPQSALCLACGSGNPVSFAELRPNSAVVDLGCGGGIDVILAARRAEKQGKVLGIDIAPEMIEAAKQAVAESSGLQPHIFFRSIDIEDIYPLPKNFADVVTANCVINLCPDRVTVYKNIFRILKPGGILIFSDFVLTEEIDLLLRKRLLSDRTGCLSRAVPANDHLHYLTKLSFEILQVENSSLTAEDLETIACYPDRDLHAPLNPEDLFRLQNKVAVATIIAKRRPLN